MNTPTLQQAYHHCQRLAARHYENFPVASWLLPASLRRPITVIYAFARSADDFADEGEREAAERLRLLDGYDEQLDRLQQHLPPAEPVFIALADVIQHHNLPLRLFKDLLHAFKQDVTKQRYADIDEILNYCRYSANPVGRLLLYLYNKATPSHLLLSDHICTALQLINFLQDIRQDYTEHNRIYLPGDEMAAYGVSEQHIHDCISDTAMQQLIETQIQRARALLLAGAPLGHELNGRFALELRMIVQGGLRVLQKLENHGGNVFQRPRLGKRDKLTLIYKALTKEKPYL